MTSSLNLRPAPDPKTFALVSFQGVTSMWLASPEVPVGMRPLAIGSDYVIGVSQGEFDVEVVSVHRLEKS